MKKENKDILINIGCIILIVGFVSYIYFGHKHRQKIMNDKKSVQFTIGEITGYDLGAKVGPWLYFFFFVNEKRIEDDNFLGEQQQQDNLKQYIGKHYLIKFSIKDPAFYNEIVWDKPVPDSLVQCCRKQVWDEPPF